MSGTPNQPFDPLVAKRNDVAAKLNRRRKSITDISVKVSEERNDFFDRLAILNAGALTFSVTLLNISTPAARPHILFVL